jgi:hypothetical protein
MGQRTSALDQSAPFGFSWGPVDKVPTPSLASREDNVSLLMYRGDRLPRSELRDTEEILEICKKEAQAELEARGIIHWSAGHTSAFTISDDLGLRGIAMVSTGPGLEACSQEHESLTGHSVSDHWMRFLPNDAGK